MWLIGIAFFKCSWWPAYLFELRVLSRNAVSLKLVMPRRLLSWKHATSCKYGTSLIPDQSGKNYCMSRILEIRLSHVKRSMLWFCLGSKGWRRLVLHNISKSNFITYTLEEKIHYSLKDQFKINHIWAHHVAPRKRRILVKLAVTTVLIWNSNGYRIRCRYSRMLQLHQFTFHV